MSSHSSNESIRLQHQGSPGGYGQDYVVNLAPGLEPLRNLNRITILQENTSRLCMCGIKNNKYKVLDENDVQIFNIVEDTSFWMRYFCGWARAFDILVIDNQAREVMQFKRPIGCGQCFNSCGNYFLPCLLTEMEVCAPPSDVIGKIRQNFSCCTPSFTGLDARGENKFHVTGSFCRSCFSDLEFKIFDSDKDTKIGEIIKRHSSCWTECCTNAHRFEIEFPINTELKDKALILASAILIVSKFTEVSNKKHRWRHRLDV